MPQLQPELLTNVGYVYHIYYQLTLVMSTGFFEFLRFLKHTLSQGSAATSWRIGGICNEHFVANFVLSLAVDEFWKSINVCEVIDMSMVSCIFLLTVYLLHIASYHSCSVRSVRTLRLRKSSGILRILRFVGQCVAGLAAFNSCPHYSCIVWVKRCPVFVVGHIRTFVSLIEFDSLVTQRTVQSTTDTVEETDSWPDSTSDSELLAHNDSTFDV